MDNHEPRLRYPAYLNDGREPIWCRDEHQAKLILGLWRASRMVGGRHPDAPSPPTMPTDA